MLTMATVLDGAFTLTKNDSENVATCVLCGKTYRYHHSTSSLAYHLRNAHPFSRQKISAPKTKDAEQPTLMESFKLSARKTESITDQLALWIAKSGRPIKVVEDPGLEALLRVATS